MGVYGLSTYLREHKRVLSKTLECNATSESLNIVIDASSFIYELYFLSGLPCIYGGEYKDFAKYVEDVVQAWIALGLKLYFVFDGAVPTPKFPTQISRTSKSKVHTSLLFFRTSQAARSNPRFIKEMRILPPHSYTVCLHALQTVALSTDSIKIYFADEEADVYAVEIAAKIQGYVAGNDSDFIILNADGYLGYIPLEEMVWTSPGLSAETEDNGDFQIVRSAKGKKKASSTTRYGKGLIPPDVPPDILSLSLSTYEPATLASHLDIPVTLLPLLGSLAGNDISSPDRSIHSMFFHSQLSPCQRITRVASTLRSTLSASVSYPNRKGKPISSVVDLIDRSVRALLTRSPSSMASGEIDAIIEKIADGALQYVVHKHIGEALGSKGCWTSEVCVLHEADDCPVVPLFTRLVGPPGTAVETAGQGARIGLSASYIEAYRQGRLEPKIVDVLNSATYWPRIFLENPDLENVGRSVGRELRVWCYAILDDGIGLMEVPGDGDVVDDDDDNLIEVVEDVPDGVGDSEKDEDLLAPLRGALQQLRSPESSPTQSFLQPLPRLSQPPRRRSHSPKVVTEYIRRGTRVVPEEVFVPPLADLLGTISVLGSEPDMLPVQLRSEDERLTILLRILGSDMPGVRDVQGEQLTAVLALRWVVRLMHSRCKESTERDKERNAKCWTKREASAFLASFEWTTDEPEGDEDTPPIVDRNVQLTAQVLMALESIEHLAQILFLSHCVKSPCARFSGRIFHSYLTGTKPLPSAGALWNVFAEGLDDAFREERRRSKTDSKPKSTTPPSRGKAKQRPSHGGLFGMLADAEA